MEHRKTTPPNVDPGAANEQAHVTSGRAASDRARSVIRDTQSLLEQIFTHIPALIAYLDTNFDFIWVNQAYARAGGREPDYYVGRNYFELFPHTENQTIFEQAVKDGKTVRVYERAFEYANDPERGTTYWDWTLQPVGSDGRVTGLILCLVDVTGRKRAEDELVRLATAIEQAAEGVAILDTSGNVRYVNPAFETITGYTRQDIVGRSYGIVKGDGPGERLWERQRDAMRRGEPWSGRVTKRKKEGSLYEAEVTITPVRCEGNSVITDFVSVLRDVSREVVLERQLRQTHKMEALGGLAGGIAHDLNNILMPIIVNTELLVEDLAPDSEQRFYAEKALSAAIRGRELVEQIVSFSRGGDDRFQPLEIAGAVEESVALVRAGLPSTIDIQLQIEASGSIVNSNATQVHQLLMNLCCNARDAMQDCGGTVSISLRDADLSEEFGELFPELRPGPYVALRVEDTGCGMSDEVRERIFEPFYTTKQQGEGSGMGLAVVHGIVQRHRGAIQVDTAPGRGTTITVLFPLSGESPSAPHVAQHRRRRAGNEVVLLVDDDQAVLTASENALLRCGYRVVACSDGDEALRAFHEFAPQLRLVIADQTMPGMTGLELAEQIRRVDPEIPLIICTGFSATVDHDRLDSLRISELLSKPVGAGELTEAARRVLDRG